MKKELILNYLIRSYLKELNPISSGELKKQYKLSLAPSTIRNYFQKLDSEGLIVKIHISSGSIPSQDALKSYWFDNLNFDKIKIKKSLLKDFSKEFDVFVTLKEKLNLTLNSVLNFNNRFIILEFEKEEIVFNYSEQLFRLLNELKGYSLENIIKFFKLLNLDITKFTLLFKIDSFNKEFLYKHYKEFQIDEILSNEIFEREKGLQFKNNYLLYKIDTFIDNIENEFIVIGDIRTDYLNFFNSIKEEK